MAASANDKFLKGVRRFSTTLASPGIANDTATSATLDSVINLPTDTGCVITIDRVDSDGALTPNKEESMVGVISGSDITNMVRGFEGTAQAHTAGAVVEVRYLAAQHNRLIDGLLVQHNQDGTHKEALVTSLKASAAEVAAGTEDAKIVTPLAAAPYANNSMFRQAIINGNFDVWQRGTSVALADGVAAYLADRWYDIHGKDGGTLPTLTRTRQALTTGDIPNAFYYSRLTTNGAGTSFGNGAYGQYPQKIEHGTRLLCGNGKKVTVSFWARSDIANKKLGIALRQSYGSGGSPTTFENITGTTWTLTSTWTKYTYTFTTNTLAGKTFGTANDDSLALDFWYMWGTTYASRIGESTAETYVGSGNIDIAQVQLCAGDVALPFQPKSFEEELRACERYYEILDLHVGKATSASAANIPVSFRVPKRSGSYTASNILLNTSGANAAEVAVAVRTFTSVAAIYTQSEFGCDISFAGASGMTTNNMVELTGKRTAIEYEL